MLRKQRPLAAEAIALHSADAVRAMIELRCTGLDIPLPRLRALAAGC
jgi:hypothetical protein